ncbi:MAG: GNAT family N-acetyltransferase [Candidatus Pacebacteria bacterium]|nr:GNAT family N-acetyltransferase [Candidatus Paceibacterota bacterium]
MSEHVAQAIGFRFAEDHDGVEVGHAYLYVLRNDLHDRPFGFLEDLFVESEYRQHGVGAHLHDRVVARARKMGCYKLIATSRNDGARDVVHAWYGRLGYRDYGTEFRMDLLR